MLAFVVECLLLPCDQAPTPGPGGYAVLSAKGSLFESQLLLAKTCCLGIQAIPTLGTAWSIFFLLSASGTFHPPYPLWSQWAYLTSTSILFYMNCFRTNIYILATISCLVLHLGHRYTASNFMSVKFRLVRFDPSFPLVKVLKFFWIYCRFSTTLSVTNFDEYTFSILI